MAVGRERTVAELPSAEEIKGLVSLLAPGLIIQGLTTRVRAGALPDLKDRLVTYGVISSAYYAVVTPLFHWKGGITLDPWTISWLEYAIVPAILAVVAAFAVQEEWDYKVAQTVGLQFAHHIPASWDYTFDLIKHGAFLLVTLKDDTIVRGRYVGDSFSSTNKDERDLLLSQLWHLDVEGAWSQVKPERSILLCGGDIRFIEIYKD